MSVETVGWVLVGQVVLVIAAAGLFFGVIPELNRRENQKTEQLMRQIAQMLRQEIALIPDLVRILEDLQRIEPERAEAMEITRKELLMKRAGFQEVVDHLERRWDA